MKFKFKPLDGAPWWQIALRGAAIPGMMVTVFAIIGALVGRANGADIFASAKAGAGFALFISFFAVLEVVFAIVFSRENKRTSLYLTLGYLSIWGACMAAFLLS